ncbi:chorismate mutase [Hysterangium stoloniferum]|nr:chorismate mutase [Hysterangium stoloniferum]
MSQNFFLADDPLSLERIRSILIRLEDTIIFSLIERAQFAHNPKIYKPGAFKELKDAGFQGSWLEWFLKETETFHAKARRYTSPDEYPFTNNLPPPVLQPLDFPKILYDNSVNANARILEFTQNDIIPRITKQATESLTAAKRAKGIVRDGEADDDGNYGSAATIDVEVLQAISKRVHYGKFVSESKFLEKPSDFVPHILSMNRLGPDGQPVVDGGSTRIDAEGVKDLYEKYIIPLTKDVDYLLQRLDGLSKAEIERTGPEIDLRMFLWSPKIN